MILFVVPHRFSDYRNPVECARLVIEALIAATTGGCGPVHINLPVDPAYTFKTAKLPDVPKIDVYNSENLPVEQLHAQLKDKRICIFMGSHKPFTKKETDAISSFAENYDAIVLYDHTSAYHGKNGMMITQASLMMKPDELADLVIDLGGICGDYHGGRQFRGRKTWRISEDGAIHNRFDGCELEKVFDCSEYCFFNALSAYVGSARYYSEVSKRYQKNECPTLPFSNLYVASKLSRLIPKNSVLHLAILNSLRSMDFFELDESILTSCNVGGFGIDGALSTLLGQSMADKSRLAFGVVGDLAFFYDMNALGNRHVHNRLRIIVVNNGRGVEFRLNKSLENQWGSDTDELIAARGHFGSAKGWAESMGFQYMTASDAEGFDKQIGEFCHPDPEHFGKPVLFEVFTEVIDEKQALANMRAFYTPVAKK